PPAEPYSEQVSECEQLLPSEWFGEQNHQQQAEEIRHKCEFKIARESDREPQPHPADEHSRTRIRADDHPSDYPETRATGTNHIILISLDLKIVIRRDTKHRTKI